MSNKIYVSYGILLLSMTAFSYLFVDYNFFYLRILYSEFHSEYRIITTVLFIFLITSFFGFYIFFLNLSKNHKLLISDLKKIVLLTSVVLFFSYPAMLSFDIFNYTTTSKIAFFYKENPYNIMPNEFVGEPFLLYTRAANKVALYGPIWILLTAIPFFVSIGNYLLMLFSLKILVVIFYLATSFIIWAATKSISRVVLFSLNPLIFVETLVSGHNDIVMMCFALLSFYLLQKKMLFYSFLFLLFSIGIKYATLFLLPLWIFVAWRMYSYKINWDKIFLLAVISMTLIFFLSPLREEIYPWYWIWVFSFIVVFRNNNKILNISILFSFCLMLRYIPYLATGNYFCYTPIFRELITFIPITGYFFYWVYKHKVVK